MNKKECKFNINGPPWICQSCGWIYTQRGVIAESNKPPHRLCSKLYQNNDTTKKINQKRIFIKNIKDYFISRSQWKKAKEPLRSPEEILYIYDNMCSTCPHFQTSTHWFILRIFKFLKHSCKICGCKLKRKGKRLNKLAWLTEQCPDNPPKWLANVPNMKEYLEKNPPKKGGCGCSGKK